MCESADDAIVEPHSEVTVVTKEVVCTMADDSEANVNGLDYNSDYNNVKPGLRKGRISLSKLRRDEARLLPSRKRRDE